MNIGAIIQLGLSFWLSKSGSATFHVGGKTQNVTVTETGAATGKLGSLTFGSAILLAEQIVVAVETNQPETFPVRLGADEYSVTITVS